MTSDNLNFILRLRSNKLTEKKWERICINHRRRYWNTFSWKCYNVRNNKSNILLKCVCVIIFLYFIRLEWCLHKYSTSKPLNRKGEIYADMPLSGKILYCRCGDMFHYNYFFHFPIFFNIVGIIFTRLINKIITLMRRMVIKQKIKRNSETHQKSLHLL